MMGKLIPTGVSNEPCHIPDRCSCGLNIWMTHDGSFTEEGLKPATLKLCKSSRALAPVRAKKTTLTSAGTQRCHIHLPFHRSAPQIPSLFSRSKL